MINNFTIKNPKISEYLNTDDSIEGLEKAVLNGQTRLALDVLVDIIEEMFERLISLEEKVLLAETAQTTAPIVEKSDLQKTSNKVKNTITEDLVSEK